jgi:hypothetical protein
MGGRKGGGRRQISPVPSSFYNPPHRLFPTLNPPPLKAPAPLSSFFLPSRASAPVRGGLYQKGNLSQRGAESPAWREGCSRGEPGGWGGVEINETLDLEDDLRSHLLL